MLEALAWGSLAAGSLVLGALLAFARPWSDRQIGLVLAFGAGALISAVSLELAEEGVRAGGFAWTAVGLAAGALTYFALDGLIARRAAARRVAQGLEAPGSAGTALALGAFLDGVPEQLVLGIAIASGEGVGVGLLVAIFISNLPEATGSATAMLAHGTSRRRTLELWIGVALLCTGATVVGWAISSSASGGLQAAINGFAAGALVVMLIDSMIPDARSMAGRAAGVVATLGFAVAIGLSSLS